MGKARNPNYVPIKTTDPAAAAKRADITLDKRTFTVAVRNAVFRFVRALSSGDTRPPSPWSRPRKLPDTLKAMLAPFHAEHGRILTDTKARAPRNTLITQDAQAWSIRQMLIDSSEHSMIGVSS